MQGDDQQRFTASSKRIGNFAFLRIEQRNQTANVLNREYRSSYTLIVRATAKRKRLNILEAVATIHLKILDENDNSPMFRELSYKLELDTRVSRYAEEEQSKNFF